jgi:cellulose synthase operon protein C
MARRSARYWLLLVGAILLPGPACAQQDGPAAQAAVEEGRYEDAIRISSDLLREEPTNDVARRALVTALREVGRYDEAIQAADGIPNLRGEALLERGQREAAEQAFRDAIEAGGPDLRTAEFNLAQLLYNRGERDEAMRRFDDFIDVYNQSAQLSAPELTAVANAVSYLGLEEPELFQDVVMAFDDAIAVDASYPEAHIRLGELFIEKYNSLEARAVFDEALAANENHPRVLLGLAKTHAFDGDLAGALSLVERSLEINPNLVPARVFLARMRLDTDQYEEAQSELEKALEVNPSSLEALSMLAAMYYVTDDRERYEETRRRVEQLNPAYAGLLTTVAEIAAQQRRYADAADLAATATKVDPQSWSAYATLGLNLFRLGRIQEARENLERSFAGDPYNVWIKNNLDLLDTFAEYREVSLPGFNLMLHEDEADLLLPYLEIAAPEAYADLSGR